MRVYTAPVAAAAWLRAQQIRTVAVYVAAATDVEFAAFQRDADRPEAVVVGDLGRDWTFDRLNQAFRQLLNGARLVAIQKTATGSRRPDGASTPAHSWPRWSSLRGSRRPWSANRARRFSRGRAGVGGVTCRHRRRG